MEVNVIGFSEILGVLVGLLTTNFGKIIVIAIVLYLMLLTLALLFVKLILRFPPIRHLCQSIYRDISGDH